MGPLHGVTVIELAGIGPGPFCAMMLADMGATVLRVDPVYDKSADYTANPVLERGRSSVAIDLKHPSGRATLLRLAERADVLLESFRPGVTERLGLGPAELLAANPRLVYARLTGWGQDGPRSMEAGHDINYIALTGALHSIGRAGQGPVAPLNLVGDFGGGAMFMAFGIVCAVLESRRSGHGQVVDANVLEATSTLMALVHGLQAVGSWQDERGTNLLDTGAPFYDTYECADGRWVAVGCIESRFYANLLDGLGLSGDAELVAAHRDRSGWPRLRAALTGAFRARTRDAWAELFAGRDACVTPVLSLAEAREDPQAVARGLYFPLPDWPLPATGPLSAAATQVVPLPRFSGTPAEPPGPAPRPGADTADVLRAAGFSPAEIDALLTEGAVRQL